MKATIILTPKQVKEAIAAYLMDKGKGKSCDQENIRFNVEMVSTDRREMDTSPQFTGASAEVEL